MNKQNPIGKDIFFCAHTEVNPNRQGWPRQGDLCCRGPATFWKNAKFAQNIMGQICHQRMLQNMKNREALPKKIMYPYP